MKYDANYIRRELSLAIAELMLEADRKHDTREIEKAVLKVQGITSHLKKDNPMKGLPGIRGFVE